MEYGPGIEVEWRKIRHVRNCLLDASDWTQSADSPLSSAKKTEWATYRTKLRTLPVDQSSVETEVDITWPTKPE